MEKENWQLKQEYQKLKHRHSLLHDECLDAECERDSLKRDVNSLEKENEQLKQSPTLYYNLFKELQRQMQGVKSIYDLDSKDFEDLIELSKGNVFDDEFGWVHLPIKEVKE